MLDATPPMNASGEDLDFRSTGAVLRGRIVRPKATPRAALVIHGATGAPAGYYRGFAEWAARERDLAVLTYDYRDFGMSLRRPMRESRATLADCGWHDQGAALAALARMYPDTPLWVLGHSVGGLWLGWHPAMDRVAPFRAGKKNGRRGGAQRGLRDDSNRLRRGTPFRRAR